MSSKHDRVIRQLHAAGLVYGYYASVRGWEGYTSIEFDAFYEEVVLGFEIRAYFGELPEIQVSMEDADDEILELLTDNTIKGPAGVFHVDRGFIKETSCK